MYFHCIDILEDQMILVEEEHIRSLPIRSLEGYTYQYNPKLDPNKVKFLELYLKGKTTFEDYIEDENWDVIKERLSSYLRTLKTSKMPLNGQTLLMTVPENLLAEYYSVRNNSLRNIHAKIECENYDHYLAVEEMLTDISRRKLNLDLDLSKFSLKDISKLKSLRKTSRVQYRQFGTVTNRLAQKKSSFPILTLKKELRKVVKPVNDIFVEFDYNAADPRMFFALQGSEQPVGDFYEFIQEMHEFSSRDDAKKNVMVWMYNEEYDGPGNVFFNKSALKKQYYTGSSITNLFGEEIDVGEDKAIPYMVQSSSSDLFLRQVVKLFRMLKEKKSFISMLIHDSVVLDMSKEDFSMLKELKEIFSNTEVGIFKTNYSVGKNYGEMEKK